MYIHHTYIKSYTRMYVHSDVTSSEIEDPGYSAVQENYEILIETIDPGKMLAAMFARKLISMKDKNMIRDLINKDDKEYACETLIDSLLNNWRRDSLLKFLEVLEKRGYNDCAAAIKGKIIAQSVWHTLTHRVTYMYIHTYIHTYIHLHYKIL